MDITKGISNETVSEFPWGRIPSSLIKASPFGTIHSLTYFPVPGSYLRTNIHEEVLVSSCDFDCRKIFWVFKMHLPWSPHVETQINYSFRDVIHCLLGLFQLLKRQLDIHIRPSEVNRTLKDMTSKEGMDPKISQSI